MAAGLRIVNDSGTIQIDELYKALSLFAKGSAQVLKQALPSGASGSFSKNEYRATITVAGASNPVLAIYSGYYCQQTSRLNNGDGTWTFLVDAEAGAENQYISYFVFDNQPKVISNSGFAVFDGTHTPVFSSDTPPLRLIDIVPGDAGTWSTSEIVAGEVAHTGYDTSRQYAFLFGKIANAFNWLPSGSQQVKFLYASAAKSVSGGINTARALMYSYVFSNTSTPNAAWSYTDYNFLVVDVTNY